MKRLVSNFQILGAVALIGGAFALQSCGAEKAVPTCVPTTMWLLPKKTTVRATNLKPKQSSTDFGRLPLPVVPSTYSVDVDPSSVEGDYRITAQTTLGLNNINPVTINLNVNQAIATSGMVDVPNINGQIDTLTLTYNSATSATLAGSLSGFDAAGLNGSFSDNGTK